MHRVPALIGVGNRMVSVPTTRGCNARYCGNFQSYRKRSRPVAGSTNSNPSFETIKTTGSPKTVFNWGDAYESLGDATDQRSAADVASNASSPLSPGPPA